MAADLNCVLLEIGNITPNCYGLSKEKTFWVIYKMSGFSANRIAFGGKTRHSHSTQLLVDESINATVRLGGGLEGETFVDYFLNVGFFREPNCI